MELNFSYISGGMQKKLVIDAKETGITFNRSDLGSFYSYHCDFFTVGSETDKYYCQYYMTAGDYPYARYEYVPAAVRNLLTPFVNWADESNQLVMKSGVENFFGAGAPSWGNYKTLSYGENNTGKIQLNFGLYTDPVTHVSYGFNSGFAKSNPRGYDEFGNGWGGLNSNSGNGFVINDAAHDYRPNLMFFTLTMHDNDVSSPTYNKDFPVIAIIRHCYGSGELNPDYDEIMFMDARLFSAEAIPSVNGSKPKQNSTPMGWGGTRNTASSSDTPTAAPVALKYSVNWGEHGIFLYKISTYNLVKLSACLWSQNLADIFQNSKFSPATAILALHKLPYVPEIDTAASASEVVVRAGGIEMNLTKVQYHISAGHPAHTYSVSPVEAYYIVGGQEQESNPVDIVPFFNSFLDFEPYTQVHIRIPFVGMVQVPTSSVMGGKLKLNYVFDNRNGNFVCQILTTSMRNSETADANGWMIIAQYTGNCALPMALTGNTQGGAAKIGAITGFASSAVQGGARMLAGDVAGGGTQLAAGAIRAIGDWVTAPHQTQLIGSVNAESSCMEDLTVRVLITRPVDVTPGEFTSIDGQSVFVGDSLITQKGLAAYSGAKVENYEGFTAGYVLGNIEEATAAEMTEIRNLFLGGVIV